MTVEALHKGRERELETAKVPQDTELKNCRANDESHRKRLKGLRTYLRLAQSPLEIQKGTVENTLNLRSCRSCVSAEATRAKRGIYASRRARENAGAELLGNR
jgi:hypothetical protein